MPTTKDASKATAAKINAFVRVLQQRCRFDSNLSRVTISKTEIRANLVGVLFRKGWHQEGLYSLLEDELYKDIVIVSSMKGVGDLELTVSVSSKRRKVDPALTEFDEFVKANIASLLVFRESVMPAAPRIVAPKIGSLVYYKATYKKKPLLVLVLVTAGQYQGTHGVSNSWTVQPVLQADDDEERAPKVSYVLDDALTVYGDFTEYSGPLQAVTTIVSNV